MFRKMEKNCAYCYYGTMLRDGTVACAKKGVVEADCKCRSFNYDPLKRIPSKPKALDFGKYDDEDFSL
ncbi:MAG: hypothetical protein E7447_04255 [Ruminococcaceae bacterium]|nr:hypothetical protein [Oscillospiraceae bacterium]